MKIRTDFVTNSSSSSFISFRLDLAPFEKLNANNNLSISLKEDDGYYFSFTTEDGEAKISSNVEGGIYTPTLPQLFMTLLLGNEAHATKEYQAVGDDWNAGYSPRDTTGLTHYSDYIVKNRPDGTNASVLKYVQELYENTDLFDKMVIDAEYSYGGGEADGSESQLGDFQTSGERTVTGYGKLKEYDAHPYLGGFGYEGQYESFIIYDSGTLELCDREMKYQEQSCIWDDERVESTILHLANTKRTFGLYRIERFSCNSVNKIILPVSCNTIEDEAFTECKNLKELHILRRNVVLGEDIAKKKVHIFSPAGGTAEQYAKEHGNPFTAVSLDSYGKCYAENERILTIGGHYQITLPEECDCFFHDDNKDSGILHGINYKLSEGTVFNSGQLTDIKFGLRHDGEKPIQTAKELCEIYMDELSIAGDITELQATERFSAAILIGRVMSILGVNGDTAILVIKDHETDPLVLMIITATRDDSLINALGYRLYQLAREIRLLPDGVVMHWAAYPIIDMTSAKQNESMLNLNSLTLGVDISDDDENDDDDDSTITIHLNLNINSEPQADNKEQIELMSSVDDLKNRIGNYAIAKEAYYDTCEQLRKHREAARMLEEERRKNAGKERNDELLHFRMFALLRAYDPSELDEAAFVNQFQRVFPELDTVELLLLRKQIERLQKFEFKIEELREKYLSLEFEQRYKNAAEALFYSLPLEQCKGDRVDLTMNGCNEWLYSEEEVNVTRERLEVLEAQFRKRIKEELFLMCPEWEDYAIAKDALFYTVADEPFPEYDPYNPYMYAPNGRYIALQLSKAPALDINFNLTPEIVYYWGVTMFDVWFDAEKSAAYQNFLELVKSENYTDEIQIYLEAKILAAEAFRRLFFSKLTSLAEEKKQESNIAEEEYHDDYKQRLHEEESKLKESCEPYYNRLTSFSQLKGKHVYTFGCENKQKLIKFLVQRAGGIYHECLDSQIDCLFYGIHNHYSRRCGKKLIVSTFSAFDHINKRLLGYPAFELDALLTNEELSIQNEMNAAIIENDPAPEKLHRYRLMVVAYIQMKCRELLGLDPEDNQQLLYINIYQYRNLRYLWAEDSDETDRILLEVIETLEKDPNKAKEWEDYFKTMTYEERKQVALFSIIEYYSTLIFDYGGKYTEPEEEAKAKLSNYCESVYELSKQWFREDEYAEVKKEIALHEEKLKSARDNIIMDFDNGALLFWETAKEYLEMHFYKSKSGSMPYNSAPNDMIGYVGYAYITVYPSFNGTKEALTQFMLDDFWKISKQEAIKIAFKKCVWSIGEGFDAALEGTPVLEETILEAKRSIWKKLGLPFQPEQKTQNAPEATSVKETPVPVRTDYTLTLRFQDSEPIPEPKSKKEGCYIATAVYGSYDAPEVMTLRRFRDEVLARSLLGRMFIKVYYTLSPSIAKRLRNARHLNNTVRIILDKWVEKLEKKQH